MKIKFQGKDVYYDLLHHRKENNIMPCKQIIKCGQTGKCLKDNCGRIYVDSDRLLTIQVEYTDQAVPGLNHENIGQTFDLFLDQRIYEYVDIEANIKNVSSVSKFTKYKVQTDSLISSDEMNIDYMQKDSDDTDNVCKEHVDQEEIKEKRRLLSYKPIITAVLVEFNMQNNPDLTSTCIMIFAEMKEKIPDKTQDIAKAEEAMTQKQTAASAEANNS